MAGFIGSQTGLQYLSNAYADRERVELLVKGHQHAWLYGRCQVEQHVVGIFEDHCSKHTHTHTVACYSNSRQ